MLNIFASSLRHPLRSTFLTAILFVAFQSLSTAQILYGLSSNRLISFKASLPGALLSNAPITGVDASMSLSGLDFRPATGELYALGYDAASGLARLYTLNTRTGAATAIGTAPVMLQAGMGKIGFDFNPTVDRIRVTGSNNANFRMHPVTGMVVATDGALSFAATDRNAGRNPSVGAVAYTNSFIGATATTLYNYDDSLNVVTTQVPPNNGTLNTVGSSGILVNLGVQNTDMDIYTDPATGANRAFLSANNHVSIANFSRLYNLNLSTGRASLIGFIGPNLKVDDIAVLIERGNQALTGPLAYALSATNNLLTFDTWKPDWIRTAVPVTGLTSGQSLVGLDCRPATGELYGMGYNATSGDAQIYKIDPATAVATPISATPVALKAGMGKVSFDFNPTVDRIRVTGSDGSNFRLHPVTGMLAATDMPLAFAASDVNASAKASIGTGAYTNSRKGATTTTLYNYDDVLNILTTQVPPNNGTLNTVGASGIAVNAADPTSDLDIYFDKSTGKNMAFLAANTANNYDQLYTVDLNTGSAASIGRIGLGIAILDLAIRVDTTTMSQRMAMDRTENTDANTSIASTTPRLSPNPARTETQLSFALTAPASVQVCVMDLSGRAVTTLHQGDLQEGMHQVSWDVAEYPAGLYIVRLMADDHLLHTSRLVVSK